MWQASLETLERQFWELVTAGDVPVEVHAALNLDTRQVGSGFTLPSARSGDTKAHPWNLHNLPAVTGCAGLLLSTPSYPGYAFVVLVLEWLARNLSAAFLAYPCTFHHPHHATQATSVDC